MVRELVTFSHHLIDRWGQFRIDADIVQRFDQEIDEVIAFIAPRFLILLFDFPVQQELIDRLYGLIGFLFHIRDPAAVVEFPDQRILFDHFRSLCRFRRRFRRRVRRCRILNDQTVFLFIQDGCDIFKEEGVDTGLPHDEVKVVLILVGVAVVQRAVRQRKHDHRKDHQREQESAQRDFILRFVFQIDQQERESWQQCQPVLRFGSLDEIPGKNADPEAAGSVLLETVVAVQEVLELQLQESVSTKEQQDQEAQDQRYFRRGLFQRKREDNGQRERHRQHPRDCDQFDLAEGYHPEDIINKIQASEQA